eukprot:6465031-Amphidinium_carterae.2
MQKLKATSSSTTVVQPKSAHTGGCASSIAAGDCVPTSTDGAVKAKAMPRRHPPPENSAAEAQPAVAPSQVAAAVAAPPRPCQVKTDQPLVDNPQSTLSARARYLDEAGVIKLQQPIYHNLTRYWQQCIVPMCAILRITPLMAVRRCGDTAVRVPYRPARHFQPPSVISLDVDTFQQLRLALVQIGGPLVALWYLSLDFVNMLVPDVDIDTRRGIAVQRLVQNAAQQVDRRYELARTPAAIFLVDVYQVVLILVPFYTVSPTDAAADVCELFNQYLLSNWDNDEALSSTPPLRTQVAAERCRWFVQGAGGAGRGCAAEADPSAPADGLQFQTVGHGVEDEDNTRYTIANSHDLAILLAPHDDPGAPASHGMAGVTARSRLHARLALDEVSDPEHWALDTWDIDFFLNPEYNDDDWQVGYQDPEPERDEKCRERRISLLRTRLVAWFAGQLLPADEPIHCESVDSDVCCTIVNPGELQALIALSRRDVASHPQTPVSRDVCSDLEPDARWEAENLISFMKFTLIALRPHLLFWWRQERTPLTVDDLVPVHVPDQSGDGGARHAWNNPQRLQNIQTDFVLEWQHLRATRGPPTILGPVPDNDVAQSEAVLRLRHELRANAIPVPAREERLLVDYI